MRKIYLVQAFLVISHFVLAQSYPDEHILIKGSDELEALITDSLNITVDNGFIGLAEGAMEGYFVLEAQSSTQAFNRGLPSWNGHAPERLSSAFRVLMRFKVNEDWSPWLTVGYWDKMIWPDYGSTSFSGGEVDIDYVKLDHYVNDFQFRVEFRRNNASYESPSIKLLSFFVSDSHTTDIIDLNKLVADSPSQLYIPTEFIYQFDVDPNFGGSICSPTSTAMILRSYDIEVDPRAFAIRNNDKYWGLYGVWPRTVQNGSRKGLEGYVTRYRSWNQAYSVLEAGGRIAISVGQPLSSAGHLIMLAGFDENGDPLVHDSAYRMGEGYHHAKEDITKAWFEKGGIAYTYYPDSNLVSSTGLLVSRDETKVFPNPFRESFTLEIYCSNEDEQLLIKVLDLSGCVVHREKRYGNKGHNSMELVPSGIKPGIYFLYIESGQRKISRKIVLSR